ncbi:MAG: hypothetical protein U5R30_15960 [Deltaproteobacteria bacterium]|nr:hypothetical protein [Deltaproteobacteria bacterium]
MRQVHFRLNWNPRQRSDVPHTTKPLPAGGEQHLPIAAEGGVAHTARMRQRGGFFAVLDIPQTGEVILAGSQGVGAVRTEGRMVNLRAGQPHEFGLPGGIPQLRGEIGCGEHARPVGTEGREPDGLLVRQD